MYLPCSYTLFVPMLTQHVQRTDITSPYHSSYAASVTVLFHFTPFSNLNAIVSIFEWNVDTKILTHRGEISFSLYFSHFLSLSLFLIYLALLCMTHFILFYPKISYVYLSSRIITEGRIGEKTKKTGIE